MKATAVHLNFMFILCHLLLLGSICSAEAATLDETQITSLFWEAQQLFRDANELAASQPERANDLYHKAALRFERIVHEGNIHNGRLFYNIGNAYFRMKNIGQAILNYRRAQRYIPNDVNLQQNLAYARSKRLDKIEETQEKQMLKRIFFWHYDLPTEVRVYLFFASFLISWLGAALLLFRRSNSARLLLAAAAFVCMLFLVSLLVETYHIKQQPPGVIISEEVIGRKGDSEAYEKSFTEPLHEGAEFVLLEKRGNWYHVELLDGRRTWIPANSAEMVFYI